MYAKSNPSDARANNRRLLFRLLFPDRQLSRTYARRRGSRAPLLRT